MLTVTLILALSLAGCSALIINPAKIDGHPNPNCTTQGKLPAMDMGASASLISSMVLGATLDSGAPDSAYVAVGLSAALFLGSALYGISNVKACIADQPAGWDPDAPPDPDSRPKKKKTSPRLVPEPGVMRSN